jgi:hypothetical protein
MLRAIIRTRSGKLEIGGGPLKKGMGEHRLGPRRPKKSVAYSSEPAGPIRTWAHAFGLESRYGLEGSRAAHHWHNKT